MMIARWRIDARGAPAQPVGPPTGACCLPGAGASVTRSSLRAADYRDDGSEKFQGPSRGPDTTFETAIAAPTGHGDPHPLPGRRTGGGSCNRGTSP